MVLLQVSDYFNARGEVGQAEKILRIMYKRTQDDVGVQARLLQALVDTDFAEAKRFQRDLPPPDFSQLQEAEDEELAEELLIEALFQEGLPGQKKQKKTKEENVEMQETDAGAEIFIPQKRKRKTILPKSVNPDMLGNLPDPERWLPKW